MTPDTRRRSWLFPALAILAGLVLLGYEWTHLFHGEPTSWFWVIVALVLVALGGAEFVARRVR